MNAPVDPEDFDHPEELQAFADIHDFGVPWEVWGMMAVFVGSIAFAAFKHWGQ